MLGGTSKKRVSGGTAGLIVSYGSLNHRNGLLVCYSQHPMHRRSYQLQKLAKLEPFEGKHRVRLQITKEIVKSFPYELYKGFACWDAFTFKGSNFTSFWSWYDLRVHGVENNILGVDFDGLGSRTRRLYPLYPHCPFYFDVPLNI